MEGEIVHRDSLGSDQPIRPGQLNLMSSGHGIANSEMSPPDLPSGMQGRRLWVALPDEARHGEPRFEHHAELPVLRDGDATIPVLACTHRSSRSRWCSQGRARIGLSLEPAFEYGVLTMSGAVDAAGTTVTRGSLLHLAPAVQS